MRRHSAAASALMTVCALAHAAETDFVRVDRIEFRGNTVFATSELATLAQSIAGRRVSVAEIEDLRQKVTRQYVDRGYVNSGALIDEAALGGGTLTVVVVEGRLDAVRIRGLDGLREGYVVARLVPDPAEPFNIDRLRERFQALLADPLFERVQSSVVPGDRLGSAYLDLDVTRASPYEATLFANNYRPPSIGEYAVGVSGRIRNLTGWGDALDLSAQVPVGSVPHDPSGDIAWRVQSARGTEAFVRWSQGPSSVVEEPGRILDIRSLVTTAEVGVSQRIYENARHRATLGITAAWRENVTTLGDDRFSFILGEPDGVTRVRSGRAWVEYANRRERGALVARATFTRNRNNLVDVTDLPAGVVQLDKENRTIVGQIYASERFTDAGLQGSFRATMQHTNDRLVPLDALAVGGVNSVRGFRENTLLRDEGGFLGLELESPFFVREDAGFAASAGAFADHGSARDQGGPRLRLSSIGLLLKARWQGVRAGLAVALHRWKSSQVPDTHGAWQDHGVHLQVSFSP
jgi:hemolysin activation/secretion protein